MDCLEFKKKKLGWWGSLYIVNILKSFPSSIINTLHNIDKVREMHTLLLFTFVVWTPPFFHFLPIKKNDKGNTEDLIEMINNLRAKSKYENSLGTNYVPLTKK